MEFIEILADQIRLEVESEIRLEVESEIRSRHSSTTFDGAANTLADKASDQTDNREYHPDLDLYLSLHSTNRHNQLDVLSARRKGAHAYQIKPQFRNSNSSMNGTLKSTPKPLPVPQRASTEAQPAAHAKKATRVARTISPIEREALAYFSSLGVELNHQAASVPELKTAFKQLALTWHPDRFSADTTTANAAISPSHKNAPATEVFAQLLVNYKLLYKIWMGVHV